MTRSMRESHPLLPAFQETGRALSAAGLVSSNSGNMSVRRAGGIVITRHDSTLARLEASDLIEVPADAPSHPLASVELVVHRAIYATTPARAVVHAHPPATIALSLALASTPETDSYHRGGGGLRFAGAGGRPVKRPPRAQDSGRARAWLIRRRGDAGGGVRVDPAARRVVPRYPRLDPLYPTRRALTQ
jgi:hypothetical protein